MPSLGPSRTSRYLQCGLNRTKLTDSLVRTGSPVTQHYARRICGARNASSLTSATAVNATKIIPSKYKALHESLQGVKKNASSFVDLSRLDLALQGLETERLKTRIAILGINGTSTSRRVAKLLLVDPLKEKEAWEDQLESSTAAAGILLKHGEPRDTSLSAQRSAIETLPIPSHFLEENNLEILIGSVNISKAGALGANYKDVSLDFFLSPAVDIPTSLSGRTTAVHFPVHKALLVSNGFNELLLLFQLLSATRSDSRRDERLIERVLNMEGSIAGFLSESVTAINSQSANKGLEVIRGDLKQAPDFENYWRESALESLKAKLLPAKETQSRPIPDLLESLIGSVLHGASSAINSETLKSSKAAESRGVTESTRRSLRDVLKTFSVRAHTELQSGIEAACSSNSWKKLSWYKLFWRVDDVPLIVSDLVERYWLPQSERAICELSGRLVQAGLLPTASSVPLAEDSTSFKDQIWDPQSSISATKISDARRALTQLSSTDLTIKAQNALAKTLAISGGSAIFAALAYLSSPMAGFYECGSIAALGIIFALRKLQADWESHRRHWRKRLFEAGADTLTEVESHTNRVIRDGGKAIEDDVDLQLRKEAQSALQSAQEALKVLSGGS